ncbi:uncharacterized protein [Aristolochia californica]|uniref:uncharacterized protein n=1 Tax=Aristolochia californica TaxID=171875 RepID=UPI0035E0F105
MDLIQGLANTNSNSDGWWTVDCICGVTFDDGEEMVNCDECGVWVHTRCSRFVKGEISFACHKCKSKKYRSNDSEETEVAQLLVELPTKTMRIEPQNPPAIPLRTPFRHWTDIPMEERVHVQGVPGDPAIFQGLSSVFTSELWKCTGYVPKKFNFQYREFPFREENENPVDRGAGVLFSLSKEIISYPAAIYERKLPPKEGKKREGGYVKVFSSDMQKFLKKERNNLRLGGAVSGKRKKEETGNLKNRSSRKKVMSADKESEKKRGATPAVDYGKLELEQDQGFKDENVDSQIAKSEEKECILPNTFVDRQVEESGDNDKRKNNLSDHVSAEVGSPEYFPHNVAPKNKEKIQNAGLEYSARPKAPETDACVSYQVEMKDGSNIVKKEEDVKSAVDALIHLDQTHNMRDLKEGSSSVAVVSMPACGDVGINILGVRDNCFLSHGSDAISPDSEQTGIKVEKEQEELQGTDVPEALSSPGKEKCSPKYSEKPSIRHLSENVSSGDNKSMKPAKVTDKKTTAVLVSSRHVEPNQCEQVSDDSTRQLAVPEGSLESWHGLKQIDDSSKLGGTNAAWNLTPGIGKSSSASFSSILSKSNHKPHIPHSSPAAVKLLQSSKQQVKADIVSGHRNKHSHVDGSRDENTKSSPSFGLKQSRGSRIPHSKVLSSKLALRKNKEDPYKEGSHNSCEPIDESKTMDRTLSSPEQKRQDHETDGSVDKRETSIGSPDPVSSGKRSMPVSSTISNSCPSSLFETNQMNLSTIRGSPRDASDDDLAATAIAGLSSRTLPGLIDDIMSTGKRMTYEELCNAVLPHWHNLRKIYGEHYAYASHSQAVLDCLRNRNEWSHLIDRGPKTNSGRKRRKLDADPLLDSEEDDKEELFKDIKEKSVKTHQEDIPKGKRKARKRRRLALQGRGVKDIRKRQKLEATAEDEPEEFTHSSEGTENYLSEDESQGGDRMTGSVESNASASNCL